MTSLSVLCSLCALPLLVVFFFFFQMTQQEQEESCYEVVLLLASCQGVIHYSPLCHNNWCVTRWVLSLHHEVDHPWYRPHAAGSCPSACCFLGMLKIHHANLRLKRALVEAELISHYCALDVETPLIVTLTSQQSCKTSPLVCLFVNELFSHTLIKSLPSFQ